MLIDFVKSSNAAKIFATQNAKKYIEFASKKHEA